MNKKKRSAAILVIAAVSLCLAAWLAKPETVTTIGSAVTAKAAAKDIYNVENQSAIRKTLDEQIAEDSYSEDDALMVYNPFGTNTLSMYTYFTTSQGAKIDLYLIVLGKSFQLLHRFMPHGINIIMHWPCPDFCIVNALCVDRPEKIFQLIKAIMAVHCTKPVLKIHHPRLPFANHFLYTQRDRRFPISEV